MRDSTPHRVTVSQRARPLRIGYVLRGFNDRRGLRAGIRLFTTLWGGMYNCFIPMCRRRPPWWRGSESGREITRGYLDAFEPDFLVVEHAGIADGIDFPTTRIVLTSDLIRQDRNVPFSHGIGVHDLFASVWTADFQYVKRTPAEFVMPRPNQPGWGTFIAACFGEYPPTDDIRPDFEDTYRLVFDAKDLRVTAEEFMRLSTEHVGHPLEAGCSYLEVPRYGGLFGPLLFFLDPVSAADLLDYWNLRAYGMNPTVVPFPWLDQLEDDVRRLIQVAHRPHPMNGAVMLSTTALAGQSQDLRHLEALVPSLRAERPGSISVGRYPSLWAKRQRLVYRPERGAVVASRKDTDVTLHDTDMSFRACELPVSVNWSLHVTAHSVRVIRVQDWSGLSGVAAAVPPDLSSAIPVLGSVTTGDVWFSSEGIVTTCRGSDPMFHWTLPLSRDVCRVWLEQHGFTFEVTSAGKLLHEAVQQLRGLNGAELLAQKELVTLLNDMAGQPDRPAKTCGGNELIETVRKTTGDRDRASHILRRLVHLGILEVGAQLSCSHCGQHNWYKVGMLDTSLPCHRCLRNFSFPAAQPPPNPWRYRTIGPFAIENYMMGGIPVLLSIRVLGGRGGLFPSGGLTWCPSFELKRGGLKWGEIDTLLFIGGDDSRAGSGLAVFVEAKSFGARDGIFTNQDVDRMRRIGQAFPGSALVFATLSSRLTETDKDLIRPLAEDGRHPMTGDHWRNPVVLLTGRELFSENGPPSCWDGVSDAVDFGRGFSASGYLVDLADATQQLYLDMEPYSEYIRRWIDNQHRT